MAEVIAQCEDEDAGEEIDAARKRPAGPSARWPRRGSNTPSASGARAVKAPLMTMLGDVPAASIVVVDIARR